MTSVRDLSQWQELQHQKNLSKYKTIAFAQAAHEFRNPLNGIVNSLNLLERMLDGNSNNYYRIAKNCSELMLFLVRDIMDFSQLEAKSFILNMAEVDPIKIVKDCFSIFDL